MVIVSSKNLKREIAMEQEISITLRFNLAIGKANLNEIVCKCKWGRCKLIHLFIAVPNK